MTECEHKRVMRVDFTDLQSPRGESPGCTITWVQCADCKLLGAQRHGWLPEGEIVWAKQETR